MDILALPDVFLRKLMRTMEFKDRMRMRLTCRAMEELVAATHAGQFKWGRISHGYYDRRYQMSVVIDDHSFGLESEESQSDQLLTLRNQLFSGITVQSFVIDTDFSLNFVSSFTKRFDIEELSLNCRTEKALLNALQLMSGFPRSKCTINLLFLPELSLILSLTPLDKLSIWARSEEPWQLSTESFFKLLGTHKDLYVKHIDITSVELKRVIQIISEDDRQRTAQFLAPPSTIINWLNKHGINEGSTLGISRELEIITSLNDGFDQYTLDLRYNKCLIRLDGFSWIGDGFLVVVTLRHGEEW